MIGNGIDTTGAVLHSAIATGTGVVFSQPNNDAQIIAVIGQLMALVLLFIRGRQPKKE